MRDTVEEAMNLKNEYSVLLFDLGGVVIDVSPFSKMLEWQGWTKDPKEIALKWRDSLAAHDYEKGLISTKEFVEKVIDEFELDVSLARFIREFRLLPRSFYPGAPELLDELSKTYTVACLSNNNELHWNKLCDVDKLERHFSKCFASHLMHRAKPGEDAYRHALHELKTPAASVAFFDDRAENVAAAKKLGLAAFQVHGFDGLRQTLAELGALPEDAQAPEPA